MSELSPLPPSSPPRTHTHAHTHTHWHTHTHTHTHARTDIHTEAHTMRASARTQVRATHTHDTLPPPPPAYTHTYPTHTHTHTRHTHTPGTHTHSVTPRAQTHPPTSLFTLFFSVFLKVFRVSSVWSVYPEEATLTADDWRCGSRRTSTRNPGIRRSTLVSPRHFMLTANPSVPVTGEFTFVTHVKGNPKTDNKQSTWTETW